jgi:hypothetical protein
VHTGARALTGSLGSIRNRASSNPDNLPEICFPALLGTSRRGCASRASPQLGYVTHSPFSFADLGAELSKVCRMMAPATVILAHPQAGVMILWAPILPVLRRSLFPLSEIASRHCPYPLPSLIRPFCPVSRSLLGTTDPFATLPACPLAPKATR